MHSDYVGLLVRLVDARELREANLAIGFKINYLIDCLIIDDDVGFIGIPSVGG
jgi:hypothetical protein